MIRRKTEGYLFILLRIIIIIIVKGSCRVTHVVSQALDRAKPGVEGRKKSPNSRSFKRLVCQNIHLHDTLKNLKLIILTYSF